MVCAAKCACAFRDGVHHVCDEHSRELLEAIGKAECGQIIEFTLPTRKSNRVWDLYVAFMLGFTVGVVVLVLDVWLES